MIDAIGFDLDGTLLDTLADLAFATNTMLAERGYPEHPVDAYRHFVGNGVDKLIERALPESKKDEVKSAKTAFQRAYVACLTRQTRPYAGVEALLDRLVARGIRLSILSNKPDLLTQRLVPALLPRFTFADVRGARDGVPKKPDPLALDEIIATSAIDKTRWLFVGDTSVDMLTASRAGVASVGVSWGFRDEAELRDAGATSIIDQPEQLLDLL